MSMREPALVCIVLLLSGCHTPPLQSIDESIAAFAMHPVDVAPHLSNLKSVETKPDGEVGNPAAVSPAQNPSQALPPTDGSANPFGTAPSTPPNPANADPSKDARAQGVADPNHGQSEPKSKTGGVIQASFTQVERGLPGQAAPPLTKFALTIPEEIPGAETPLVKLPDDRARRGAAIARLFPQLPPLPEEPIPMPGPSGRAYTLADLQQLAAANSPALRQAASDVENARGQMIQAGLYPNPTIGYTTAPNANNTASTTQGFYVDQVIKTGGKLRIQTAVAKMNMVAAELALKRARYDLATTIRGDYYSLLVAKETLRVNKGLARFTDEIFKLQADLLAGGFTASHEPAALRSQAFLVRLGYQQSIANYVYAWKQLVADMGLKQLPLSEVEGQVDRLIPNYNYDAVLASVLRNHTDVLTARANLEGTKVGLKLAQITPVPDVEVYAGVWKEQQILPLQNYYQMTVSIPLALWDRNQGNILSASSSLVRAAEGPHQAEVALTTNLAAAYATYKTNLAAVEYYRRNILPDQVRYYRGVFERRKIDPSVAFGDLVQAQQVLVTDVTAYLGVLGSLWNSVVNVADFLQTDDLFQLGKPLELPQLPDFDSLHPLPCPHTGVAPSPTVNQDAPPPVPIPNAITTTEKGLVKPSIQPGDWFADPKTAQLGERFINSAVPGPGPPIRSLTEYDPLSVRAGTLKQRPGSQPNQPLRPDLSQRSSTASSRSSS